MARCGWQQRTQERLVVPALFSYLRWHQSHTGLVHTSKALQLHLRHGPPSAVLGGGFAHDPAQNSGLASMSEGTPSPGHGEPRADPRQTYPRFWRVIV